MHHLSKNLHYFDSVSSAGASRLHPPVQQHRATTTPLFEFYIDKLECHVSANRGISLRKPNFPSPQQQSTKSLDSKRPVRTKKSPLWQRKKKTIRKNHHTKRKVLHNKQKSKRRATMAATFMERINVNPQHGTHYSHEIQEQFAADERSGTPESLDDTVHQSRGSLTSGHYTNEIQEDIVEEGSVQIKSSVTSRNQRTSNELYVGNLDHALSDSRVLKDLFQKVVGPVQECRIPHQDGRKAHGFAFVRFLYSRDAVRASRLQGLVLDRRPLVLMLKKNDPSFE
mmetsp:Transcript_9596/g.35559  ORF Transcript_9596/g.35559 Transcript_9596/m.35559 type:complete len:283 (+) Transcript_9596:98-946(+)